MSRVQRETLNIYTSPKLKEIWRAIIKYEIKALLQRLSLSGEESILLTACASTSTYSSLGSPEGVSFMAKVELDALQRQFLSFVKEKLSAGPAQTGNLQMVNQSASFIAKQINVPEACEQHDHRMTHGQAGPGHPTVVPSTCAQPVIASSTQPSDVAAPVSPLRGPVPVCLHKNRAEMASSSSSSVSQSSTVQQNLEDSNTESSVDPTEIAEILANIRSNATSWNAEASPAGFLITSPVKSISKVVESPRSRSLDIVTGGDRPRRSSCGKSPENVTYHGKTSGMRSRSSGPKFQDRSPRRRSPRFSGDDKAVIVGDRQEGEAGQTDEEMASPEPETRDQGQEMKRVEKSGSKTRSQRKLDDLQVEKYPVVQLERVDGGTGPVERYWGHDSQKRIERSSSKRKNVHPRRIEGAVGSKPASQEVKDKSTKQFERSQDGKSDKQQDIRSKQSLVYDGGKIEAPSKATGIGYPIFAEVDTPVRLIKSLNKSQAKNTKMPSDPEDDSDVSLYMEADDIEESDMPSLNEPADVVVVGEEMPKLKKFVDETDGQPKENRKHCRNVFDVIGDKISVKSDQQTKPKKMLSCDESPIEIADGEVERGNAQELESSQSDLPLISSDAWQSRSRQKQPRLAAQKEASKSQWVDPKQKVITPGNVEVLFQVGKAVKDVTESVEIQDQFEQSQESGAKASSRPQPNPVSQVSDGGSSLIDTPGVQIRFEPRNAPVSSSPSKQSQNKWEQSYSSFLGIRDVKVTFDPIASVNTSSGSSQTSTTVKDSPPKSVPVGSVEYKSNSTGQNVRQKLMYDDNVNDNDDVTENADETPSVNPGSAKSYQLYTQKQQKISSPDIIIIQPLPKDSFVTPKPIGQSLLQPMALKESSLMPLSADQSLLQHTPDKDTTKGNIIIETPKGHPPIFSKGQLILPPSSTARIGGSLLRGEVQKAQASGLQSTACAVTRSGTVPFDTPKVLVEYQPQVSPSSIGQIAGQKTEELQVLPQIMSTSIQSEHPMVTTLSASTTQRQDRTSDSTKDGGSQFVSMFSSQKVDIRTVDPGNQIFGTEGLQPFKSPQAASLMTTSPQVDNPLVTLSSAAAGRSLEVSPRIGLQSQTHVTVTDSHFYESQPLSAPEVTVPGLDDETLIGISHDVEPDEETDLEMHVFVDGKTSGNENSDESDEEISRDDEDDDSDDYSNSSEVDDDSLVDEDYAPQKKKAKIASKSKPEVKVKKEKKKVASSEEVQVSVSKPCECKDCGKRYKYSTSLRQHIREKHQHRTLFQCSECLKNFKSKLTVQRHYQKHLTGEIFDCPECGNQFVTRKLRDMHYSTAHYKAEVEVQSVMSPASPEKRKQSSSEPMQQNGLAASKPQDSPPKPAKTTPPKAVSDSLRSQTTKLVEKSPGSASRNSKQMKKKNKVHRKKKLKVRLPLTPSKMLKRVTKRELMKTKSQNISVRRGRVQELGTRLLFSPRRKTCRLLLSLQQTLHPRKSVVNDNGSQQ